MMNGPMENIPALGVYYILGKMLDLSHAFSHLIRIKLL